MATGELHVIVNDCPWVGIGRAGDITALEKAIPISTEKADHCSTCSRQLPGAC